MPLARSCSTPMRARCSAGWLRAGRDDRTRQADASTASPTWREFVRLGGMSAADFGQPAHDRHAEATTKQQSRVTPETDKVPLIREDYPNVNVKLLSRKDFQKLIG